VIFPLTNKAYMWLIHEVRQSFIIISFIESRQIMKPFELWESTLIVDFFVKSSAMFFIIFLNIASSISDHLQKQVWAANERTEAHLFAS